ncbi:MAG: hypothetical protein ACM37W_04700 [Actinomycetota bacterium]
MTSIVQKIAAATLAGAALSLATLPTKPAAAHNPQASLADLTASTQVREGSLLLAASPSPSPMATKTPSPKPSATKPPSPKPSATKPPSPKPSATKPPSPKPSATKPPSPKPTTSPR